MSETKVHEIELRDLAGLLRRKLGDELELIDQSTESLLPLGENYGSTILKVRALVKRQPDAEPEELHLVAKMLPATDFQRSMFDSPYTFRKEAFLYEELIPAYQRLEKEFGLDVPFDILPEFYGARFSLTGDFDDNAVILMSNLKEQGYYTTARTQGLDLEHARIAITNLARFHALGLAMKSHKPDAFEAIKFRAKCMKFKEDLDFESTNNFILRVMADDPEMSVHEKWLRDAMNQDVSKLWMAAPPEPWGTIVHADFWSNNIMFRRGQSGRVEDVKFVDFQNYLYLSFLRELIFFLVTSLHEEVIERHFDELLDSYYDKFIAVMKTMDCDVEPFARDKFDERMRIDAYLEFPHCPFMIKIVTADVKENEKIDDVENRMMNSGASSFFVDRLRSCVKKYAEKGWLEPQKKRE